MIPISVEDSKSTVATRFDFFSVASVLLGDFNENTPRNQPCPETRQQVYQERLEFSRGMSAKSFRHFTNVSPTVPDTPLSLSFSIFHSSDILLSLSFSIFHSSDTLLSLSFSIFHSFDTLISLTFSVFHSSTSSLFAVFHSPSCF